MPEDDNIFPLVDRRTPILDRIRQNGDVSSVGEETGKEVARIATETNQQRKEEMASEFVRGFNKGMAEVLDVPESAVDNEIAMSIAGASIESNREDLLTEEAREEFSMVESSLERVEERAEEESDEEPSDSDSEFSTA